MQNNHDIIQEYTRRDFYKDISELIKLFEKFHGLNKQDCKHKKTITVKCPFCSREKNTTVSDSLFEENEEFIALQFLRGTCCEHSFYVVIDKNLNVCDYQIHDRQLDHTNNINKIEQTNKENIINNEEFNSSNTVNKPSTTDLNKNPVREKMSKEKIYNEFKDLIDKDNPEFREFVIQEKNEKSN